MGQRGHVKFCDKKSDEGRWFLAVHILPWWHFCRSGLSLVLGGGHGIVVVGRLAPLLVGTQVSWVWLCGGLGRSGFGSWRECLLTRISRFRSALEQAIFCRVGAST
jgi:hypothetical protein